LIAAGENRGPLKIYELKRSVKPLPVNTDDVSVIVRYKDRKTQKREMNYGASFLSQPGRFVIVDSNVAAIEVTNSSGARRTINFQ
jgi:hypothetical protein